MTLKVYRQIFSTARTRWRFELDSFGWRTHDRRVGDAGGHHPTDEVGQWRDAIHEHPELGYGRWGHQDTDGNILVPLFQSKQQKVV